MLRMGKRCFRNRRIFYLLSEKVIYKATKARLKVQWTKIEIACIKTQRTPDALFIEVNGSNERFNQVCEAIWIYWS